MSTSTPLLEMSEIKKEVYSQILVNDMDHKETTRERITGVFFHAENKQAHEQAIDSLIEDKVIYEKDGLLRTIAADYKPWER